MAEKRSQQKPSELPIDIEEEILARLPVKTLLRFQCVCRRWRLLFRNKAFVAKHMTFAERKFLLFDGSRSRSIIYHQNGGNRKPEMILEDRDLIHARGGDYLDRVRLVDHCNGIIFLQRTDNKLVLWNPATREVVTINYRLPAYSRLAGFGYDCTTNEYKIVTLRLNPRRTMLESPDWGEIFKLKYDRKMFISPINSDTTVMGRTPQSDRYIFWLINHVSADKYFILSFDVVLETFDHFSCPPFDVSKAHVEAFRDLKIVRRRLCLVDHHVYEAENKIVVWASAAAADQNRDDNDSETWIKWFTIPIAELGIPRNNMISEFLLERCSDCDDKELLIVVYEFRRRNDQIFSYNVEEDKFTKVVNNFPICGQLEYLETMTTFLDS